MEFKAIIFDKDGTLIDFEKTFNPATATVLERLYGSNPDELKAAADVIDFDLETQTVGNDSIVIAASSFEIAEALATVRKVESVERFCEELDRMYGEVCVDTVEALPGVETALKQLKSAGLQLGVGTNDAEANAVLQMQTLGWKDNFYKIFGADSGFGPKPGPGMINAFLDCCGLKPQQVIMVGDSLHDLESGKAAGVMTCGVETGPADRVTLEKHADIVLRSVSEMPENLGF